MRSKRGNKPGKEKTVSSGGSKAKVILDLSGRERAVLKTEFDPSRNGNRNLDAAGIVRKIQGHVSLGAWFGDSTAAPKNKINLVHVSGSSKTIPADKFVEMTQRL